MYNKIIIMIFLVTSIAFAQDNLKKVEIKTSAVCNQCKERIESKLLENEAVKKADLTVETQKVVVEFDSTKIEIDDIKTIISDLGYDADNFKKSKKGFKKLPKCCQADKVH